MGRVDQAIEGLSEKQKGLMLWLLKYVEALEVRADDLAFDYLTNGIPWRTANKEAARRAATSRSLLRLEERELIERVAPNKRTKAVKLSVLGRLVAIKIRGPKR